MATITLKGNPMKTFGELPAVGSSLPKFHLVSSDLSPFASGDVQGKKVVLNIFPSVDTPVCANSVRKFNEQAAGLNNAVVVCISKDLPFAQSRFCGAEGIENVRLGSAFKDESFGRDFGVLVTEGPLAGLFARAIVVADESGKVVYQELVPEIAQEPDYESALAAIGQ